MNINRHNYEEFFILYLDNELTQEQRREVETFATAHPDPKGELDLLSQSKLSPDEDIIFNGKEQLLQPVSTSISLADHENWFLLYTDNELNDAERTKLEEWVKTQPELQKEWSLWQKARLQPDLSIVYPDKKSLYRYERMETRVVAFRWWRMAAAAALLLGVSTAAFMFNQEKQDRLANRADRQTSNTMADAGKQTRSMPVSPAVPVAPGRDTGTSDAENSQSGSIQQQIKPGSAPFAKNNIDYAAGLPAENIETRPASAVQTAKNNIEERFQNSASIEEQFTPPTRDLRSSTTPTIAEEINPIAAVTPGSDEALYSTNTPIDDFEIDVNETGKKNRFRGFFRKVTRTLEKNTNIKATDGDDRLLVGALSIKL